MKQNALVFFMGSYTEMLSPDFGGSGEGIYTVALNVDTGEITNLHSLFTANPSYLVLSEDKKFLFCNTEVSRDNSPKVQSYRVKDDFSLEFINEQDINGGYPCHIEKLGDSILVACYQTGNVLQFPIDSNGSLVECAKNYQHSGSSINKARQEGPHAHQSVVHPNGKDVYVADLGLDKLKAYAFDTNEFLKNDQKDIAVALGNGPRHIVFNMRGDVGYIINELSGEIMVMEPQGDRFKVTTSYSSLPPGYEGIPSSSAIRIHPNGKYVYAANRGANAITICKIIEKKLEILDYQFTEGIELREFNISPDGKWLIACHQNSHDIVVYQIGLDGKLIEMYRTKDIKSPVCVVF